MSTILVTGACGFIGSHLCARLVSDGHQVHEVSRFHRPESRAGIQWWRADVCEVGTVRSLLRKIHPQIVFHLAMRVTGSRELGKGARLSRRISRARCMFWWAQSLDASA
jgi:nucleoside-diphosphate-sugar epimerase